MEKEVGAPFYSFGNHCRREEMNFPKSYSKVVAKLGPEVKSLNFLPFRHFPLQLPGSALQIVVWDRSGTSWGQWGPPEERAFRLRRDFQAIKKTGGHTLQAESFDLELYRMVCGYLNVPHAMGIGWVRVWVVGAAEEAPWSRKEAPTGCRGGVRIQRSKSERPFFPMSIFLAPLPPAILGPSSGRSALSTH